MKRTDLEKLKRQARELRRRLTKDDQRVIDFLLAELGLALNVVTMAKWALDEANISCAIETLDARKPHDNCAACALTAAVNEQVRG